MLLTSCAIFGVFFLMLFAAESLIDSLRGVLLQWQDPAFIVGIPASVVGVAYVLTIRNPKNYTGFILGIVMSLLLAWQFYLQGNMDLVMLYTLVFIPFMVLSLRAWRQSTLGLVKEDKPLEPTFVDNRKFLMIVLVFVAVVVLDYVLVTLLINHDGWCDDMLIKLLGGTMISSRPMCCCATITPFSTSRSQRLPPSTTAPTTSSPSTASSDARSCCGRLAASASANSPTTLR